MRPQAPSPEHGEASSPERGVPWDRARRSRASRSRCLSPAAANTREDADRTRTVTAQPAARRLAARRSRSVLPQASVRLGHVLTASPSRYRRSRAADPREPPGRGKESHSTLDSVCWQKRARRQRGSSETRRLHPRPTRKDAACCGKNETLDPRDGRLFRAPAVMTRTQRGADGMRTVCGRYREASAGLPHTEGPSDRGEEQGFLQGVDGRRAAARPA